MTKGSFAAFLLLVVLGLHVASGSAQSRRLHLRRELESPDIKSSKEDPNMFSFFTLIKSNPSREYGEPARTCGGSLIAPDVVLTSAQCAQACALGPFATVDVWVNSTSVEYSEYQYFRKAVRWVVHPDFSALSSSNDIALLILDEPVVDVPLVLMNRDASIPGDDSRDPLTAIGLGEKGRSGARYSQGWSSSSYSGMSAYSEGTTTSKKDLVQLPVNPKPTLACSKAYGSANFKKSMLCASEDGFSTMSCQGGSGNPLLIPSSSAKENVQVGIVSSGSSSSRYSSRMNGDVYYGYDDGMGMDSGRDDAAKSYTRVSYYAEWVDAQICQFSASKPSSCPTTDVEV